MFDVHLQAVCTFLCGMLIFTSFSNCFDYIVAATSAEMPWGFVGLHSWIRLFHDSFASAAGPGVWLRCSDLVIAELIVLMTIACAESVAPVGKMESTVL